MESDDDDCDGARRRVRNDDGEKGSTDVGLSRRIVATSTANDNDSMTFIIMLQTLAAGYLLFGISILNNLCLQDWPMSLSCCLLFVVLFLVSVLVHAVLVLVVLVLMTHNNFLAGEESEWQRWKTDRQIRYSYSRVSFKIILSGHHFDKKY